MSDLCLSLHIIIITSIVTPMSFTSKDETFQKNITFIKINYFQWMLIKTNHSSTKIVPPSPCLFNRIINIYVSCSGPGPGLARRGCMHIASCMVIQILTCRPNHWLTANAIIYLDAVKQAVWWKPPQNDRLQGGNPTQSPHSVSGGASGTCFFKLFGVIDS